MTAPNPPREATRRVSDEKVADDVAHVLDYALTVDSYFMALAGYPADLRDSRALVADLTRRLAEAERREREAWCAGRDAAALCLSGVEPTSCCNDRRSAQRDMREIGVTAIRALNPPNPEGDRG